MRTRVLAIAVLTAVYAVTARLGLSLDAVSGFATLVWPGTGLALAALLLFGSRLWPGVFLGAWIVNVWTGAPVAVALGIAVGNTLEAVLGALVLRQLGFRNSLGSVRLVLGLIVGAAAVTTIVSATVGVASLAAGGIVRSPHQAIETWRAWWVGDVLGALIVAPLILAWVTKPERCAPSVGRVVEAVALATLLGGASIAVFFRPATPIYPVESPYILFPLFVWAALRFELRGATLATACVSGVAIWGTIRGVGPFTRDTVASGLLALQTFMGCAAVTPLVVAGVTADRARAVLAQDTFVATVSHDLRNPLNTLLLSGEAHLKANPDELVQKHHQILKRSVDTMLRLVTDLLDASAIERQHLAIEKKREDLWGVVSDAVELLRPLAAAKQIVLEAEAAQSMDVSCDRDRMIQVLSNVIGNAIKFSPAESVVTIGVDRDDQLAHIFVRDHGPGIARGDLHRIFERHWHAKSSAGGGSGLGLFIAKGIIEAHGGTISVESRVGSGTTFHLRLPLYPVSAQSASQQTEQEHIRLTRRQPERG